LTATTRSERGGAGLIVANAVDAWSPAVADHAVSQMLALFRQLPVVFAARKQHAWVGGGDL
jgi:phosphoglycerate dehydrogenase-like enzyme